MACLAVLCALAGAFAAGCDGAGQASRPPPEAAVKAQSPTRPISSPKGPATTPPPHALTRVFDSIRRRYAGEILGICMGAIDQGTSAVKCYGKVARGSRKHPNATTLFQIGSISKTFTATLLALRVQSGAAKLEDPVRQYLPVADGAARVPESMTLLDLAQHYSGLPRSTPFGDGTASSLDHYLAAVGACEASPGCRVGPPGRRYVYSNYAYGVLGELLGTHDGFSESGASAWEQDNVANITGPLGLVDTRSWFGWRALSSKTFDARRARPDQAVSPPYFPPAPYADAAAGLDSTANDMVKWLSFSMGLTGTPELNAARPLLYETPSLLRPRENQSDKRKRVGLAWRVDSHGKGASRASCVYKDGLTRGFTASIVFEKSRGVGGFVMLNTEPENTPAIATDLVNSLPSVARATPNLCGAVR